MGIQSGMIKFTGTVGELNGYYVNGKYILRKAGGGFNGEAIRTHPKMVRVRENASEFGRCSTTNKVFRQALHELLAGLPNTSLYRRLLRCFTQIKDLDTVHPRGSRYIYQGLTIPSGKELLQKFDFTPNEDPKVHFGGNWTVAWDPALLSLTSLKAARVPFPPSATHVQLTYGILLFDYKTLTGRFAMEPPVLLEQGFSETQLALPFSVPEGPGIKHLFVKLQYVQQQANDLLPLQEKQALGLVALSE